MLTISETLAEARKLLSSNPNITQVNLEANILLEFVLNKPLTYLLINDNILLANSEYDSYFKALTRRLASEPIAYIVGNKEFYNNIFTINNHVLIPRPETELLVDRVIDIYNEQKLSLNNRVNILELGTGSGCIIISLLLKLSNVYAKATDISIQALEIAKNNSLFYRVNDNIEFINSNWFNNIAKNEYNKYNFIISNPPYVSFDERYTKMAYETYTFEPHQALFAEGHGLKSYEKIAQSAKNYLKNDGKLFLEIGYNQCLAVKKLYLNYGYKFDSIHTDINGIERVIIFSK